MEEVHSILEGDATRTDRQTPPVMLQRLHQRSLQSPSTINIQQLHRNFAQPQTTVVRLMRRLDLSNQIESRYQSGGTQTQRFIPRFSGQRREVSGLGSEAMLQRVPVELGQRDTDLVTVRDNSYGIPSPKGDADAHFPQTSSSRYLTVEHSATAAVTPRPTAKSASSVIQAKADQPTTGINRLTSVSDATTALPSGLFQISRQAIATSPASTITPVFPSHPQELSSPTFSQTSKIKSPSIQLPLKVTQPKIQAKTQDTSTTPITMQRIARPAELLLRSPGNLDASVSQPTVTEPSVGVTSSENQGQSASVADTQTSLQSGSDNFALSQRQTASPVIKVSSTGSTPMQLKPLSLPLPIQTQLKGGETANVGTILRYSTNSQQVRSTDTLQGQSSSAIPPTSEVRPLHTPIISTTLIQRQTETLPAADTGLTTVSATSPPPPAVVNSAASEVDIAEIAEQVSRVILRRMIVERERRGSGK
jgi:hypothetical protein